LSFFARLSTRVFCRFRLIFVNGVGYRVRVGFYTCMAHSTRENGNFPGTELIFWYIPFSSFLSSVFGGDLGGYFGVGDGIVLYTYICKTNRTDNGHQKSVWWRWMDEWDIKRRRLFVIHDDLPTCRCHVWFLMPHHGYTKSPSRRPGPARLLTKREQHHNTLLLLPAYLTLTTSPPPPSSPSRNKQQQS